MEPALVQLLISAAFGILCSAVASSRGRNPVGWFFLGFFFPCLAILLLFVLPDVKAQQRREELLRRENRKLRERVTKDRMVADRRHSSLERRLDVHDQTLGLDTREPDSIPHRSTRPLPIPFDFNAQQWYLEAGETESRGPFSMYDLRSQWRRGEIDGNTEIWTPDMDQWATIADVRGLREALDD